MGKDLLSCKLNGKTVFSTENSLIKNQIVNILMDIDCVVNYVEITNKKGEKAKTKKFIINEFTIIKLIDNKLLLWLQEGMEVYVYYNNEL